MERCTKQVVAGLELNIMVGNDNVEGWESTEPRLGIELEVAGVTEWNHSQRLAIRTSQQVLTAST